jgi:hypothetical protein
MGAADRHLKMKHPNTQPAGTCFSRLNAPKRRSAGFLCHLYPAKAHLDKGFRAFDAGSGRT